MEWILWIAFVLHLFATYGAQRGFSSELVPLLKRPAPISEPAESMPQYVIYWWENAPYTSLVPGSARPPHDVAVPLNLTQISGFFLAVLADVRDQCGHFLQEPEAAAAGGTSADATPSSAGGRSKDGVRHVDDDRYWRYVLVGNQLDLLSYLSDEVGQSFSASASAPDRPTFFLPFTTHTATSGLTEDDQMWFAPLVESPGAVHFFRKEMEPPASDITDVLRQSWPLLILILLGAAYSGIIIWLLDRQKNPTDFPKQFISGFWEGFWWAFVTMTTVGYGDTTPRSIQARIFGLIWIVVGITLLSVFTATVTSVLTKSSLISHYSLQGVEVAVLNGSEECSLALSLGAMIIAVNDFDEMVATMDNKVAKAAIVDQFVFAINQDKLEDNYLLDRIYPFPVSHGIVVRGGNRNMRTCATTYLAKRRLRHVTDLAAQVPPIQIPTVLEHNSAQDLFRTETVIYMLYVAAVWAVIFAGFVLWQCLYWTPKHRRRQEIKKKLQPEGTLNDSETPPAAQNSAPKIATNRKAYRKHIKRKHTLMNKESSKIYKAFKANAKQARKMATFLNSGFEGIPTNYVENATLNDTSEMGVVPDCSHSEYDMPKSTSSDIIKESSSVQPILKNQYMEIKQFKDDFLSFKRRWVQELTEAKMRHRKELERALSDLQRYEIPTENDGREGYRRTDSSESSKNFTIA